MSTQIRSPLEILEAQFTAKLEKVVGSGTDWGDFEIQIVHIYENLDTFDLEIKFYSQCLTLYEIDKLAKILQTRDLNVFCEDYETDAYKKRVEFLGIAVFGAKL